MFSSKPAPITEKVVRVKDPLNTELAKLYTKLLSEHNALLVEHRELLTKLRETPLYAAGSQTPLYYTEEQEEQLDKSKLRLAPAMPIPDPFGDERLDEAELRFASNLVGNAELQ